MGPPYVGIGSNQGGYPLCPGSVACCDVRIIRMQVEALVSQPAYGYHTTTAKPQRNTNTHRTRAIQPMK